MQNFVHLNQSFSQNFHKRSFEAVIPVLCDRAVFVLFHPNGDNNNDNKPVVPPSTTSSNGSSTSSTTTTTSKTTSPTSSFPKPSTSPPRATDLADSSKWFVRRQKMMMTRFDDELEKAGANGALRPLKEWSLPGGEKTSTSGSGDFLVFFI